jgi:RimJ/RimL family protein N-acetyltransferase
MDVPTLNGEIVRLEALTWAHEEELWAASRDPRTWRWLSVTQPRTRAEWHRWMEETLLQRDQMPFATVIEGRRKNLPVPPDHLRRSASRTGDFVAGSTRFLNMRPGDRSVEIGWTWLAPSAWGTGVNVEAKLLMLEHAFETMRCRRVELKTDALNERSRGALEALGATFEGVHRKHMLVRGGENRDSAWYSVIDDEWPGVRERLLRRLARLGQ